MVVQNEELGRMFGVKSVGAARYGKELHNGERRDVCVAPDIVRVANERAQCGGGDFGEQTRRKEATWKNQAYLGK